MKRHRVRSIVVLFLFGASVAGAAADEMTVAPALIVTAPTGPLAWTGAYLGVNAGYGWSSSFVSYNPNDPAAQAGTCGGAGSGGIRGRCIPQGDYYTKGGLAGGQIGYNYQISSMWVTGAEADYQWADLSGQGISPFRLGSVGNTNMTADQSIKSFGTLRLRMGAVPANPILLYGTGGLAFGQIGANLNVLSPGAGTLSSGGYSYRCGTGGTTCFAGASSRTAVGWTLGAGAELALTTRFTLKTEVLYVDLNAYNATVTATSAPSGKPASFSASFSPAGFLVARGGLNFRF